MWQRATALMDSFGVPRQAVVAGDTLAFDPRTRLHVLYPATTPAAGTDPNDASVVLRLQFGETSWLLTGDAEAGAEAALAARFGGVLAVDVVKVGHHGSSTSSTPPFVRRVDARGVAFAVVSVAERNRYGLPDAPVLTRWADAGAAVLQTAEEGAVWLRSDGQRVTRVGWR